jgi:hypothetical protein
MSIWFNSVAFHRAIVRPILRLYESVVINLVRRIIRSFKGNLIRWWIWLKLIKRDRVRISKGVRIYRKMIYEGKDM